MVGPGSPSPCEVSPSAFITRAWKSAKVIVDEHPSSITEDGDTEGHLILTRRVEVLMIFRLYDAQWSPALKSEACLPVQPRLFLGLRKMILYRG